MSLCRIVWQGDLGSEFAFYELAVLQMPHLQNGRGNLL